MNTQPFDFKPYVDRIVNFVELQLSRAKNRGIDKFESHLEIQLKGYESNLVFVFGTFGNPEYELTCELEINNLKPYGEDNDTYIDMEHDFTRANFKNKLPWDLKGYLTSWEKSLNITERLKPLTITEPPPQEEYEFKAFDYDNPAHQHIGVQLTLLYYASGDFKDVYPEDEGIPGEDGLYLQILNEFVRGRKFDKQTPETDEIMSKWLTKEGYRFYDWTFLQINYKNTAQAEPGEPIHDVRGGFYGFKDDEDDIDPAGGHGLHSHE
jgi:hypothetical protein